MLARWPFSLLGAAVFLALSGLPAAALAEETAAPFPPPKLTRDPITLDVGLHGGVAVRLTDPQSYTIKDAAGGNMGLSVLVGTSKSFAFGVEFDHTSLGRDTTGVGELGTADVSRDLNALWASLRLYLVRTEPISFYLVFAPGIGIQSEDVSGLGPTSFTQPAVPFTCSGTGSPTFGLRGGAGIDIGLGNNLFLTTEALMEGDALSSDPLGKCLLGPGNIAAFNLRAGFAYRFDITRHVR